MPNHSNSSSCLLALWGKLIFAIGLGRQFAGAPWRTCLRWRSRLPTTRFKALLVGALINPGLRVYASIIGLKLYPDSRFSILR